MSSAIATASSATTALSSASRAAAGDMVDEYLTFTLGREEYGVDILKVQEIRGYDTVTRLPDAPDYIKGVINLRGTIVPVIDMRLKFRLAKAEYNALTVMIVLNVADRVVGMVVDSVSDVIRLDAEQIRPVPRSDRNRDRRVAHGFLLLLVMRDVRRRPVRPRPAPRRRRRGRGARRGSSRWPRRARTRSRERSRGTGDPG